jgi:hypothetical protein
VKRSAGSDYQQENGQHLELGMEKSIVNPTSRDRFKIKLLRSGRSTNCASTRDGFAQ